MEIRQANILDAAKISYLISRNTEKVLENRYSPEQVNIWKKMNSPQIIKQNIENRVVFCGFKEGNLVGTISLLKNEVIGLYVSYSKRKQGIGRQLLRHLEDYAQEIGVFDLTLTSTPSAENFYIKSGFVPQNRVDVIIENVIFNELFMVKKLNGQNHELAYNRINFND